MCCVESSRQKDYLTHLFAEFLNHLLVAFCQMKFRVNFFGKLRLST